MTGRAVVIEEAFASCCSPAQAGGSPRARSCAIASRLLPPRDDYAWLTVAGGRTSVSYQTIIVETHDAVGLVKLNRPQALNALNSELIGELNEALARLRARQGDRLHRHHRLGQGVCRRRRHQGDAPKDLHGRLSRGFHRAVGSASRASASRSSRRWRALRSAAAASSR